MQHIEAVEDAVQSALMTALEKWKVDGLPDNPSAWLFRVASNKTINELRARSGHLRILEQNAELSAAIQGWSPEQYSSSDVRDDLLRMLFVCCEEAIPADSRLILALKTLCGFSVREIAHRLFLSETNVYKRIGRARDRLSELSIRPDELTEKKYASRLHSVLRILYLMFTEGYLSSHAELSIRRELCEEAIRLSLVLAEHPVGETPETAALLALMHFHLARMASRQDPSGGLLLLEEQDRTLWDQQAIAVGLEWLAESAKGDNFSRYHAEARIAAEHCLAPSFEETKWDRVAEAYAILERVGPSAVHRLNRAVAVAEWRGAAAGLEILADFEPPTWLTGSYMWSAVLADLHRRCGHAQEAQRYRDLAVNSAPTHALADLLNRRLRS